MNVIIGAGLSGLSAGQALGGDFMILEKNAVAGGLAGQYQAGGFAFDYGGHYFHFQGKPEIKKHVERFHSFRRYRGPGWGGHSPHARCFSALFSCSGLGTISFA